MATFIHITNAQLEPRIRRNGLTTSKIRVRAAWERMMRPRCRNGTWMPYDPAIIASWPRARMLTDREYDILRGNGGAGLVGYIDDFLNDDKYRKPFEFENKVITTRGVYLMPLVQNDQISYGWVREIGRRFKAIVAVQVVIPDTEIVYVGMYNGDKDRMTAAEAVKHVMDQEIITMSQAQEVILPRSVRPDEIRRIVAMPKRLGWRNWPGSHGSRPYGKWWE